MNKYLVTGATGFIGSRLIKLLNTSECEIQIISRHGHNHLKTFICDFQINNIPKFAFEAVDTVFHLAAFTHDTRDEHLVKDLYQKVNVDSTIEMAKIAANAGVKSFIFVSSVKAGDHQFLKKSGSKKGQSEPQGIYGKTKREAEIKLLEIGLNSGMHISIVRPALVYGPSVKGNLSMMLNGIKRGWFPPLPKVNNCRSMIHVDDLVVALLLVASDDRANGEIYIATDGRQYSSREIYEAMCNLLNQPIPKWSVPKILFSLLAMLSPAMKYKVNKLLGSECYSSDKLKLLGFKPKLTIREMNEATF